MPALISPLPHHARTLHHALDEILQLSRGPVSVAVFHGDESAGFRAALLLSDPERLQFLWPTAGGIVAIREESEQECLIWAETIRLQWDRQLSVGVSGDIQDAQQCFASAYVAMGKARSLGGGLSVGAQTLMRAA